MKICWLQLKKPWLYMTLDHSLLSITKFSYHFWLHFLQSLVVKKDCWYPNCDRVFVIEKKTFEIAADVDITPQKYNAKTQIWNIFTSFLLTPQFHAFLVAFTSFTKNWKKRLSLFYNVTVLWYFLKNYYL